MNRDEAEELLRDAVGDPEVCFRDGQWEAIDALVNTKSRLLLVQKTGWGKSIVYFIASKAFWDAGKKITLIVSPLLALMRNQLQAAGRLNLIAETINSSNANEHNEIIERIKNGQINLLLISPERLANDRFRDEVLIPIASQLGLLVIDEAHCISDWGHDFRPDYRRIVVLRHALLR